MSSDPAIEAAQRACEAQGDDLIDNDVAVDTAIAAAREALEPLRQLHTRRQKMRDVICDDCRQVWPCATAKLVYPAEELT